jgi:hypothetical protein
MNFKEIEKISDEFNAVEKKFINFIILVFLHYRLLGILLCCAVTYQAFQSQ